MTIFRPTQIGVALAALVLSAIPAASQVMVSNLGVTPDGFSDIAADSWFASPFLTGNSAPSFDLDEVQLGMDVATTGGGNFFVAIHGDASGNVGAQIATLSGSADPLTAGVYSYSATGVTLNANTTYWIVAGVSSGSAIYSWNFVGAGTTSTWEILNQFTSSINPPGNWDPPSAGPQQFSVSVVPEPGSASLAILGALAGIVLRRHRR